MTPLETHSILCFICMALFALIGYRINQCNRKGYYIDNEHLFDDYQHYRNYVFYLWCWLVWVGIAVVVTGSLVFQSLPK